MLFFFFFFSNKNRWGVFFPLFVFKVCTPQEKKREEWGIISIGTTRILGVKTRKNGLGWDHRRNQSFPRVFRVLKLLQGFAEICLCHAHHITSTKHQKCQQYIHAKHNSPPLFYVLTHTYTHTHNTHNTHIIQHNTHIIQHNTHTIHTQYTHNTHTIHIIQYNTHNTIQHTPA